MADVNTIMRWKLGSYDFFIGSDGDLHKDLHSALYDKFRIPVWDIIRELESDLTEYLE